jgi:hypothetical protein
MMYILVLAERIKDWNVIDVAKMGPIAVMFRFLTVAFSIFTATVLHGFWNKADNITSLFNKIEGVTAKMDQSGCQLSQKTKVRIS